MSWSQHLPLLLSSFMRLSILIAIIIAAYEGFWLNVFIATSILVLTFLPALLERNYKIVIPLEIEVFLIFFIYASLFLGEIHGYYTKLWWWDIFLHTFSAFLLGGIGFLMVYILNTDEHVRLRMSPAFLSLFAFTFALSMGALWEIFEFFMDQVFGMNMQKSGLVDTMEDLIVDSIGAFLAVLCGYFYAKKVKVPLITKLISRFREDNPDIFTQRDKRKI